MATAQLSSRANSLSCRESLGTFDTPAVQPALRHLLTRLRPLTLLARRPSRFDVACRPEAHSRHIVDVRPPALPPASLPGASEGRFP